MRFSRWDPCKPCRCSPQHPTVPAAGGSATLHRQNFLAGEGLQSPKNFRLGWAGDPPSSSKFKTPKIAPCRQHARAALGGLPSLRRRPREVPRDCRALAMRLADGFADYDPENEAPDNDDESGSEESADEHAGTEHYVAVG